MPINFKFLLGSISEFFVLSSEKVMHIANILQGEVNPSSKSFRQIRNNNGPKTDP